MDRKWEAGAAVSPPALINNSDGYATDGNPGTGTPATTPGAHWYHMTTEELIAVILAGDITPDKTDVTQVLASIQAMLSGGAVVNGKVVITHSAVTHTWTVALKTLNGADASATAPIFVAFRHATAADGSRVMRKVTGALSMVISNGSTLGHSSGTNQDVFVYLIDNAGTVELAVSALSPGSEGTFGNTRLISTTAEGGAGGADSGTGIYSTIARSNVPWLCIAHAISNQIAAGTWDAAPVVTDMAPFSQGSAAVSGSTPAAVTLAGSAGAAQTASRSDHVHALDQSIAPTMNATWTFSKSATNASDAAIVLSSASPRIAFRETDVGTDDQWWNLAIVAGQLRVQAENGAHNSVSDVMIFDRNALNVDYVHFPANGGNVNFRVGADDGVSDFGGGNSWLAAIRATGSALRIATSALGIATDPVVYVQHQVASGNNKFFSFLTDSTNPERGNIDFNRAGTAVRFNTTCDGDLKTEIVEAGSALQMVMALKVRSFKWKENGFHVAHGFVAQEAAEVCPEAVSEGGNGRQWAMDFSKLVPLLTKALQETIARCQELEQRVVALEAAN